MAKLLALYNRPESSEQFDTHYLEVHLPLIEKLPGLRKLETSSGSVDTPNGPSPYHLAAILSFDSLAELTAALQTKAAHDAVDDLSNFARAGMTMLIFDSVAR